MYRFLLLLFGFILPLGARAASHHRGKSLHACVLYKDLGRLSALAPPPRCHLPVLAKVCTRVTRVSYNYKHYKTAPWAPVVAGMEDEDERADSHLFGTVTGRYDKHDL